MKRRDLFRQAMNQHLPDRKNILNTILTEAPASAPRHIGGRSAGYSAIGCLRNALLFLGEAS